MKAEKRADPAEIDRLVHEPARMAILSILDGVASTDFMFLQRALGLTKGNLSVHLSKLEAGGLISSSKAFERSIPRTTLSITPEGRQARADHWRQLERLRGLSSFED